MICPPKCTDSEKTCPVDSKQPGCKENDICVTREKANDGILCTGVCPVNCPDDKLHCPQPNDPESGCKNLPKCQPKQKDKDKKYCSFQECPLFCEKSEHLCSGKVGNDGCKEADNCVAKLKNNITKEYCPGTCPVDCQQDELLCKGQQQCGTGCFTADTCKPKATNLQGEYCPDDSSSHGCSVDCCDDSLPCLVERKNLGCEGRIKYFPKSFGNGGKPCPKPSDCPTICEHDQLLCEVNEKDETGCKKPDICIQKDKDSIGNLCVAYCPVDCKNDEILCLGHKNKLGCKEPDSCEKRAKKLWGFEKGDPCPGVCPKEGCEPGEILCPSQLDPCNGCPLEETCAKKHMDKNGMPCPDDSASHGCPKTCYYEDDPMNDNNANELILCTMKENQKGCKPEEHCVPRAKALSGEPCPLDSVCEPQCSPDETQCPKGVDSDGCKRPDVCLKTETDIDGVPCESQCPQICEENQISCSVKPLSNGCPGLNSCIDKGSFGKNNLGEPCPAYCTPICPDGTDHTFSEDECELPPTCATGI
jgi:hypothetical protein